MSGPDALRLRSETPLVSEGLLRDVVSGVLRVQVDADTSRAGHLVMNGDLAGHRLEDLGLDSLLVAEVIVELEQCLDLLLELDADSRLATLADLRRALRPVFPA